MAEEKRPVQEAAIEGTSPNIDTGSIPVANDSNKAAVLDSTVENQYGVVVTLLRRAVEKVRSGIPRHDVGNQLASQLIIHKFDEVNASVVMAEYQRLVDGLKGEPYPKEEMWRQLAHRYRFEPDGKPWLDLTPEKEKKAAMVSESEGERLSDVGNGRRFAQMYVGQAFYAEGLGWHVWDEKRWKADPEELGVQSLAKRLGEAMLLEAINELDEEKRSKLVKWSLQSEGAARVKAAVDMAASEMRKPANWLDTNPWLLNCLNGTVDLRTGQLRPHKKGDYITKVTRVEYDPNARCPLFLRHIRRVLPDVEIQRYLGRLLGYCLTGSIKEQIAPIEFGGGANGKSTVFTAVRELMGDYAGMAPAGLLVKKKFGERHASEPLDLMGKRLVVSVETDKAVHLDSAAVKQQTGGESLKGRALYHTTYTEFQPTHKPVLITNHKPIVDDTDDGIWRRLQLMLWAEKISDEEKDLNLPDKLRGEYAGILAWLVQGCLRWQEEGLAPPPAIVAATDEYRSDSDLIGQFLQENTTPAFARRERVDAVYGTYEIWAKESGLHPMAKTSFGREMKARGYTSEATRGARFYVGLALLDDARAVKLAVLRNVGT